MKLTFNSITLGGGPNYYLDNNFDALNGELDNVAIKLPRSDNSININDFLSAKTRTFTGKLIGDDESDYRTKKRLLANLLRQSYTFTLTDDYNPLGAGFTTFETYEFTGKIVRFDVNDNPRSTFSDYRLSIFCPDPLIYLQTAITDTCVPAVPGFIFPLTFPFTFASAGNTITVNNTGIDAYPIFTITGAGSGFYIKNETNTSLSNPYFRYNSGISTNDVLTINPNPSASIKALLGGLNVNSNTNGNYEALKVLAGTNTFSFFVESAADVNTAAGISFKPAFIGI